MQEHSSGLINKWKCQDHTHNQYDTILLIKKGKQKSKQRVEKSKIQFKFNIFERMKMHNVNFIVYM